MYYHIERSCKMHFDHCFLTMVNNWSGLFYLQRGLVRSLSVLRSQVWPNDESVSCIAHFLSTSLFLFLFVHTCFLQRQMRAAWGMLSSAFGPFSCFVDSMSFLYFSCRILQMLNRRFLEWGTRLPVWPKWVSTITHKCNSPFCHFHKLSEVISCFLCQNTAVVVPAVPGVGHEVTCLTQVFSHCIPQNVQNDFLFLVSESCSCWTSGSWKTSSPPGGSLTGRTARRLRTRATASPSRTSAACSSSSSSASVSDSSRSPLSITGEYLWVLLVSTFVYYWWVPLSITGEYLWILLLSTFEYWLWVPSTITGECL